MESGKQFSVGSGLTDEMRNAPPAVSLAPEPPVCLLTLADNVRSEQIGSIITYRFFSLTKDLVPRFPTFAGIRVDKTRAKDAVMRKTDIV